MLSIDLHPVFRSQRDIDNALRTFLVRAAASGQTSVEVVHGKGSGQLRARVVTFLEQPHVRKLYRTYQLDDVNTGRLVVHLR